MAQAFAISDFVCPRCGTTLAPADPAETETRCPNCRWVGQVYLFQRMPVNSIAAESALPEDATCMHHPRKIATAICAGTGDYICSLCTIDLNGQTYSADYLNNGGKETLGKAFSRTLPRPDSQIRLYLVGLFIIPYVDIILAIFAFLWIPHAFMLYSKALRMRREDKLFARVMSKSSVIGLPILLSLVGLGWILCVVGYIVYRSHRL
jgi:phage FluMu protein Com